MESSLDIDKSHWYQHLGWDAVWNLALLLISLIVGMGWSMEFSSVVVDLDRTISARAACTVSKYFCNVSPPMYREITPSSAMRVLTPEV